MLKIRCDKCKGWGIVKDEKEMKSESFKCQNCFDKICYICENSKSLFIECNHCDGKGEISCLIVDKKK